MLHTQHGAGSVLPITLVGTVQGDPCSVAITTSPAAGLGLVGRGDCTTLSHEDAKRLTERLMTAARRLSGYFHQAYLPIPAASSTGGFRQSTIQMGDGHGVDQGHQGTDHAG
jgi:hypothetical protein